MDTERTVAQELRSDKRVYGLTPAGWAVVQQWLVESKMEPDFYILEDRQPDLQTRMQGPQPEKELLFPLLIVELKRATFRAELEWADWVMERLA